MKVCEYCKHEVQWRYKDGWGIMACSGWFIGKDEGHPQDAPTGNAKSFNVGGVMPL